MPGRLKLLDDQPARLDGDRLHFGRYLAALENTVLNRAETAPMAVGIFGPWGSGKSTLLGMLEEKLSSGERDKNNCPKWNNWIEVRFSPWMYRHEKSLLLPLLAELSKQLPAFEKLVKTIIKHGPKLAQALSTMGMSAATNGLPLLTFLSSLNSKNPLVDNQDAIKDLQEKISDAIKASTTGIEGFPDGKRIMFLIDDLDRCHDHAQVVNLLEQIKLFLHLERCVFFIAADREQIVKAIDKEFSGSGEDYLEKFFQLSFHLPLHQSQHLLDLLGSDEEGRNSKYRWVCEVLGNNPRKLKRIWNEAVLTLSVLEEEIARKQRLAHEPRLELVLKWLLLKDCGSLKDDPYRYLEFELATAPSRDEFIEALDLKNKKQGWRSDYHRRLGIHFWNDLKNNGSRFRNKEIFELYVLATTEGGADSRLKIEERCFEGDNASQFKNEDFSAVDLCGTYIPKASFESCNFRGADFSHGKLTDSTFTCCDLFGSKFDGADLEGVKFIDCPNLETLQTSPDIYETIVDQAVLHWKSDWDATSSESLFKAYRAIEKILRDDNSITQAIEDRLRGKAKAIRERIVAAKSDGK